MNTRVDETTYYASVGDNDFHITADNEVIEVVDWNATESHGDFFDRGDAQSYIEARELLWHTWQSVKMHNPFPLVY